MAPKKKGQKIALQDFFQTAATEGSSWADEEYDLPTAPAARDDSVPKRGDPGYLDSMPDRSSRATGFPGAPSQREELPLPTVPPFTAFIGNLSFEPDVEDQVKDFFKDLSPVSVRIVKDPTGKPKGFGYVEFRTQDGLKEALNRSMSQLQGRSIRVNVAEAPSTSRHPPSAAEEASQWRRSTPLPTREPSYAPSSDLDWSSVRGAKFVPAPPSAGPLRRNSSGLGRSREPREPSAGDNVDQWRSNRPLADIKAGRDTPPHQAGANSGASSPSIADKEEVWSRGTKLRTPTSTSNVPSRQGSEAGDSPKLAPPTERKRLNLAPRTASANTSAPATAESNRAGIFGSAKPVDSAAREKAAEDKLAHREEERKKARESEKKKLRQEEEKGSLLQEEKLKSIRTAGANAGGAQPSGQQYNKLPAKKQPSDKPRRDEQGFETVTAHVQASQKPASGPKKDYSTRPQFSFAAAAGSLKNELVHAKDEEEQVTKEIEEVKI
ncbi:uncharacterized protein L203_104440 [Cryptococcus depauperatus CBS 7841]|uniref:Uncharacterized protein n=1 Tax=Cryptococcus depauperatus CBS 7841 TaxID=1295531 RepID=A0A1E3IG93_9TREE|nr:translation initiation factor 4B [Cryptococcus depauperatus CBS 7841]